MLRTLLFPNVSSTWAGSYQVPRSKTGWIFMSDCIVCSFGMFGEVLETWTTATRYGFWPKKRVSLLSIVLLGQLVPKPQCYSSISPKDIVLNSRNIVPLSIVLFLYYVLHRLGPLFHQFWLHLWSLQLFLIFACCGLLNSVSSVTPLLVESLQGFLRSREIT